MMKVWLLENEQARWFEFEEPHDMPSDVTVTMLTETEQPAQQNPVAAAWDEGYRQGVKDERTSEANIGIAGFGAKVEPARQNPYGTTPAHRTWVGLTDEEIADIFELNSAILSGGEYDMDEVMYDKGFENAVATIEAKLKEKNT